MKYFFKYNFRAKHYALILSENKKFYKYLMLTHVSKTNDKNNIPLSLNPNIFDDKPAFLSARVVTRSKSIFSKKEAKHLQLSPEDELLVTNFLEEKQKRKEQTEDNEPERER